MASTDSTSQMNKGALNDRVYDFIVSQIAVGTYALNTRLPTEMKLAETLSVSRPVVRQALRRLREDGLVTSRQGAGTFVIRQPAHQVFSFADVGSVADIQKCFVFRSAVESEAAALAASEQEPSALENLREAASKLETSLRSGMGGVEEDILFHQAVAAASGNRFFLSTMAAIASQIRVGVGLNRSLTLDQSVARTNAVLQEHQQITSAILAQDPDKARYAMQTHLENARLRTFGGGAY